MTSPSTAGVATTSVPRRWGSVLLLHKIPLYAQARQYAATDPDDATAEPNVLSYGVGSYPLLAAVRNSFHVVANDDGGAGSREPKSSLVDREAFAGIHSAVYAHVPAQRKWTTTSSVLSGEAVVAVPLAGPTLQRAAAASVLDDAMGPPTLAAVLEPWFGLVADRLVLEAQRQQQEGDEKKAAQHNEEAPEQQKQRREETAEDVAMEAETIRFLSAEAVRAHTRKRVLDDDRASRGAVYTRAEAVLLHYQLATAEEKEMLRSVRLSAGDADGAPAEAAPTSSSSSATFSPPEAWGPRMMSLVSAAVAGRSGYCGSSTEEEAAQQQKVLAYLKRVRWITTQWCGAAGQAALRDSAAAPTWGQMTEAQRVRTEMAHTQAQRRRFRRTRRGPGGDGAATEE